MAAKSAEITQITTEGYKYSEAEINKNVKANLKEQAVLTTRQRMLLKQHEREEARGAVGASDLAARPMKFQRNVLGQAIVQADEHE